jgi:D-aminopeptidase
MITRVGQTPMPDHPRARDLGIPFDGEPGPSNAITDVPGVEVGYTTISQPHRVLEVGVGPVRTGVTAILPRGKRSDPSPVWSGIFRLNGNGEMTGSHWIDDAGYFLGPMLITNTHSVGMAHHAAVGWMIERYASHAQADHMWMMPVVAETYDGFTNDINGQHLTARHALDAIESAAPGPIAEGNVGGGTGMICYAFKGGTGTASRIAQAGAQPYTVAALVQANCGKRSELTVRGVPVGRHLTQERPYEGILEHDTGSIIIVIGTDAPLLPHQLQRLARRGALGLARTGSTGGHYSGDIVLAFSVANDIGMVPLGSGEHSQSHSLTALDEHHLNAIYTAAVESVEEAILNVLVAAQTMTLVKPEGSRCVALDHDSLRDVMRQFNRLDEVGS